MNVLCVIRDRAELLHFVQTLHKSGYEAASASTLEEAHQRIEKGVAPVVVVDAEFPIADGLELIRAARTMRYDRSGYIVLLRRHLAEDDLVRAYEAGLDADWHKDASDRLVAARLRTIAMRFTGEIPKGLPSKRAEEEVARNATPVVARDVELERVAASSTWKGMTTGLAAAASTFLTLPVKASTAEALNKVVDLAVGILLSSAEHQFEMRVALSCDRAAASVLSQHLFGEDSEELQSDVLSELANISMGALKSSLGRESIALTGSLPQVIEPSNVDGFVAGCQRQELLSLGVQSHRVCVRVGLLLKRNVLVPAGSLVEGMIVAKDVFNARGMLLLAGGMRLSSTGAERLRLALPAKQPIEVAPGGA
ncbi:MAG: response regulator [Polyangiaceae bacterium]